VWAIAVFALLVLRLDGKTKFSYLSIGMILSLILSFIIGFTSFGLSYALISQLSQSIIVLGVLIFFSNSFDRKYFENSTNIAVKVVLVYAVYQLFARIYTLPFAFLPVTNDMLTLIEEASGYQRGFRLSGTSRIMEARVSSFFVEPGHLGFFGAFVFFSSKMRSTRKLAFLLILLSQSLGAYVITLIVFLLYHLSWRNALVYISVLCAGIIFLLHTETNYYFLSRLKLYLYGGWEVIKVQARFSDLQLIWSTWKSNFLLGTGLATIKSILPDATFSIHYLVILFERGVLGLFIYIIAFFSKKKTTLWFFIFTALFWKPYIFYIPLFFALAIIDNENTVYSRSRT
jgi:hypothetical protein